MYPPPRPQEKDTLKSQSLVLQMETLFGNRVTVEVTGSDEVILEWGGGPRIPPDWCPHIGRWPYENGHTRRTAREHRGLGWCIYGPKDSKDCQQRTGNWEDAKKDSSVGSKRAQPCWYAKFGPLGFITMKQCISVIFSHPVHVALLQTAALGNTYMEL